MYADSRGKLRTTGVSVEALYSFENGEARARCAFCIIVVRLRPAKVGQHAVTEELGHIAAETLDLLCSRTVITGNDLPPFFRIQSGGESGRIREIAKKHG